jgi:hypothetical protein
MRGQSVGPSSRRLAGFRIDAEFEQLVESRVKRRKCQRAAADLIPVECLQVAEVEDEAVAVRDGPVVHGLGLDEFEQRIGLRSCCEEAIAKAAGLLVLDGNVHRKLTRSSSLNGTILQWSS